MLQLRELGPELDTFARTPAPALVRLHGDPEGPTPAVSDTSMLASLPAEAVEAFVAAAGPGSGSLLATAELRQLGGALGRAHPGAGALPELDGRFALFAAAIAPDTEAAVRGRHDARRLTAALSPWANGRHYLNFTEHAVDLATAYAPAVYARLRALRATLDPDGLFLANHTLGPTVP